jgi:hypothetical protein
MFTWESDGPHGTFAMGTVGFPWEPGAEGY